MSQCLGFLVPETIPLIEEITCWVLGPSETDGVQDADELTLYSLALSLRFLFSNEVSMGGKQADYDSMARSLCITLGLQIEYLFWCLKYMNNTLFEPLGVTG